MCNGVIVPSSFTYSLRPITSCYDFYCDRFNCYYNILYFIVYITEVGKVEINFLLFYVDGFIVDVFSSIFLDFRSFYGLL